MKRALPFLFLFFAMPSRAAVPDVASAATVTLHGTGIYRVTGTSTIQTIKGLRDGDIVVFLPAAAFGMNSAGNISPVTTTAVAGRPIFLVVANGTVYEQGPSIGGLTSPVAIADGGTGQTDSVNAFNALSPTALKGDIIARATLGDVRVPVGADGDVLTADSFQSAGVHFAAPPSGAGGTEYVEDTASVDAEKLTMAGVVRKDTAATMVSTDGDRTELQVDNTGSLWVNVRTAVTTTPPSNATTNVTQWGGNNVDTNSGAKSVGTIRVVLATDQPALTNKLLVTPDSVALPANQSVNVAQINAVTPLMGNGITGTGSPRVTIASDTSSNTNPFLMKFSQTTTDNDVDVATIAAGANIIGKVGIDQTTPGTTNGVRPDTSGATAAAVPARADYIGLNDGTNTVGSKSASAANNSTTIVTGMQIATPVSTWCINHTPAAATKATISQAAGAAGVRHVATFYSACFAAGATAGPVQTFTVRDGATGAGTVLWSGAMSAPVNDGSCTTGTLFKVGTAATAMTIEFGAAGAATTIETVSLCGYDVQ